MFRNLILKTKARQAFSYYNVMVRVHFHLAFKNCMELNNPFGHEVLEEIMRKRMISVTEPDWQREKPMRFWDPGRKLLKSIRDYQKYQDKSNCLTPVYKKLAIIRHRFWSVVTGADIPLNAQIAGGLLIPHPNGIVIHPKSIIGPNCLIFQQVTIGDKSGGVPLIGGHVDIGAGAKVLGEIIIGNHVCIGANAVVINDVADKCTVVGIPAQVINKS